MSQQYFVMAKAVKTAKGFHVSGQWIADGEISVPSDGGGGGSSAGKLPPISVPDPFEVKWILPPNIGDGSFYHASKAFAESMGYETVEHDDFSYPPPRG